MAENGRKTKRDNDIFSVIELLNTPSLGMGSRNAIRMKSSIILRPWPTKQMTETIDQTLQQPLAARGSESIHTTSKQKRKRKVTQFLLQVSQRSDERFYSSSICALVRIQPCLSLSQQKAQHSQFSSRNNKRGNTGVAEQEYQTTVYYNLLLKWITYREQYWIQ